MEYTVKLIIYFFIIGSQVDYMWPRPIIILEGKIRKSRQVVQPTWLTRPDFFFFNAPKVRVTEENLKETAAIRESIQNAVKAGTFAVDVSQPEPQTPVIESTEKSQESQPISNFQFPKFDFSQWNWQLFSVEQQNAFAEGMRRWWQEFVDNSRKWMNFGF